MKEIKLYNITKKVNSTLLPTDENLLITTEVVLKNATSIDTPTFIISSDDMEIIWLINYASYEGNFYWVNDIIQRTNNHVELVCKKDVLATYKQWIIDAKCYVIYSSSNGNTDTVDNRLGISNNIHMEVDYADTSDVFLIDPDLIVEITNNVGQAFNTPYLLTGAEAQFFKNQICDPVFLDFFKQFFSNPMENIIQAHYTTCNVGNLDDFGIFEPIVVGKKVLNEDTKGHRFDPRKAIRSVKTLNIPWYVDDFRKGRPYTTITLYLPYLGLVELDNSLLYNSTKLSIEILIEVLTGNIIYNILRNEDNSIIATYNACCNSSAPIAQIRTHNPVDIALGFSEHFIGLASAQPIISLKGVQMGLSALQQHTQINGVMSSILGSRMSQRIYIYTWTKIFDTEPTEIRNLIGLPFYSTVELSTLSGYVQCEDASVAAPTMESEIREINNFLNGGVYLE